MPTETKRCVSSDQAKIEIDKVLRDSFGDDYGQSKRFRNDLEYKIVTKKENGEFEVETFKKNELELNLSDLLEAITGKDTILVATSKNDKKHIIIGAAEKDGKYIVSNDIVQEPEQLEQSMEENIVERAMKNKVTTGMVDESLFEKFIEFFKSLFEAFMTQDLSLIEKPFVEDNFSKVQKETSILGARDLLGISGNVTENQFKKEPHKWVFTNLDEKALDAPMRIRIVKCCAIAEKMGLDLEDNLAPDATPRDVLCTIHELAATKMEADLLAGKVSPDMHVLMEAVESLGKELKGMEYVDLTKVNWDKGIDNFRTLLGMMDVAEESRKKLFDAEESKQLKEEDVVKIEKGKVIKEYFKAFEVSSKGERRTALWTSSENLVKMLNNYEPGEEYSKVLDNTYLDKMKAVAKRLNQDMMQKKIHSDMKQEMKWQAELKKENVKREKNNEAFKKEQAENKKTTSL